MSIFFTCGAENIALDVIDVKYWVLFLGKFCAIEK